MGLIKGLGNLISGLIVLAISSAWFVFTIWGLVTWEANTGLVTNKTTIVLLYVPVFIGMFIIFLIVNAIAASSFREKKKEKEDSKV